MSDDRVVELHCPGCGGNCVIAAVRLSDRQILHKCSRCGDVTATQAFMDRSLIEKIDGYTELIATLRLASADKIAELYCVECDGHITIGAVQLSDCQLVHKCIHCDGVTKGGLFMSRELLETLHAGNTPERIAARH